MFSPLSLRQAIIIACENYKDPPMFPYKFFNSFGRWMSRDRDSRSSCSWRLPSRKTGFTYCTQVQVVYEMYITCDYFLCLRVDDSYCIFRGYRSPTKSNKVWRRVTFLIIRWDLVLLYSSSKGRRGFRPTLRDVYDRLYFLLEKGVETTGGTRNIPLCHWLSSFVVHVFHRSEVLDLHKKISCIISEVLHSSISTQVTTK